MKFNKWTLGLAALGVVSLASVARAADEPVNYLQTMVTGTTIDGYVDVSAQWNVGDQTFFSPFATTGTGFTPPYAFGGIGKSDGFNLNVVQLSIAKPLDETEWASGYQVDLWFGPDAGTLGTDSVFGNAGDFAVRQAYVALRMPVGNGIDWKIGVFDTVIGYESLTSANNPNYTRSYGFTIEPTTHTGILGTYRINDSISFSVGVANTVGPMNNQRANLSGNKGESYKTYMGSIALTAPSNWGWASGSSFYFGVVNGWGAGSLGPLNGPGNQTSWYAGGTLATPVAGLKFGAAFDYFDSHSGTGTPTPFFVTPVGTDAMTYAVYLSYQATDKLSLHGRAELGTIERPNPLGSRNIQVYALTGTVQYDLWKNVISRAEIRWDHGDEGSYFSSENGFFTARNAVMLAANVIYKF